MLLQASGPGEISSVAKQEGTALTLVQQFKDLPLSGKVLYGGCTVAVALVVAKAYGILCGPKDTKISSQS